MTVEKKTTVRVCPFGVEFQIIKFPADFMRTCAL